MPPSIQDLALFLHECRKERSSFQALRLHEQMCAAGIETNTLLANQLVSALVDLECTHDAQRIFARLVFRDDCSWNSLIVGHVQAGHPSCALSLYQKMQEEGFACTRLHAFVSLVNACAGSRDVEAGWKMHAEIASKGYIGKDPSLESSLIDMYAKCGALQEARELHDRFASRNVVSWTSLVSGYVEVSQFKQALDCANEMQREGILLNVFTFVYCLKACSSTGSITRGHEMHAEITKNGCLESNAFLGSALVNMYVKCGALSDAHNVFDTLPVRNEVSWNVLITGYCDFDLAEEALFCFSEMQKNRISFNNSTFVCTLKACSIALSLSTGREIHAEVTKKGLEKVMMINNVLVNMYAKCGAMTEAEQVFNQITVRDVISWTTILTGYVECDCCEHALSCLNRMLHEGINLNDVALLSCLKACSSLRSLNLAKEMHIYVVKKGMESGASITCSLIGIYSKCDSLLDGKHVFDKLEIRTTATWNAVIVGFMEHGKNREACDVFAVMEKDCMPPDSITFVCKLKLCTENELPMVHDEISKKGLERETSISNVLIDMYAKYGLFAEARYMLDRLPSIVAWTTLIAGLTEHGHAEVAVCLFQQLQDSGMCPSAITFVCILKACATMQSVIRGQEIHIEVMRKGIGNELLVSSALVDMYFKCTLVVEGQHVFNKTVDRDTALWNALIMGYTENGRCEEAIGCFGDMQREGIPPDAVTIVCCLKACGNIRNIIMGLGMHTIISKLGLEGEINVGNSLLDMYAKHGLILEVQKVLELLPVHDVVSWNALISGFSERGMSNEVVRCLQRMQNKNISPDAITFVCSLRAINSVGSVEEGQKAFQEIVMRGLEVEYLLRNTIIDMYVAYNLLQEAQDVFEKCPVKTQASWNTFLAGYAEVGDRESMFCLCEKMVACQKLDHVSFITMLKACSHLGLVDEAYYLWSAMKLSDDSLGTVLEHYSCLIDLMARAGHSEDLFILIERMPLHPSVVMWHTLLAACKTWNAVKLADYVFKQITSLNDSCTTAYVCMLSI